MIVSGFQAAVVFGEVSPDQHGFFTETSYDSTADQKNAAHLCGAIHRLRLNNGFRNLPV